MICSSGLLHHRKPLNVLFLANSTIFTVARLQSGYALRDCAQKTARLIYIIHCSVKNSLHPDANFFLYNIVANDTQSSDSDHRLCFSSRHLSQHSLLPFLLGLFSSQIYTTSWPHSTQYIRTVILLEMLDHIIDRPKSPLSPPNIDLILTVLKQTLNFM